jgi:hypothetical protein
MRRKAKTFYDDLLLRSSGGRRHTGTLKRFESS